LGRRSSLQRFGLAIFFLVIASCQSAPTIQPDAVQRAMQFRQRDFVGCFEENYKRPVEGKYRLTFTIGDDGSIYNATPDRKVQTLPVVTLFDDCMIGILKETAFPVPNSAGEVNVNYPFYFTWSKEVPKNGAAPAVSPSPAVKSETK
jgi:hypothetical protein